MVPVRVEDQALAIDAIIPASGPLAGGTRVTIQGTGLGTTCTAMFGDLAATNASLSSDDLMVATPPHARGVRALLSTA